jgi:phage terminase large subunit-like protein
MREPSVSTLPAPATESPAHWLASQPARQAQFLASLSDDDAAILRYDWRFWARPSQLPPDHLDWHIWLVLAGRGWGKTRTGAEWVRAQVESGRCRRIALLNDTAADVRDVNVEGPDGILAVCPPWDRPVYESSKRRVTWNNGAVAILYAAETPDLLRGPQHDGAWADEPAKWKNLRTVDREGGTAWDNLMMGLRIGDNPQCVATTTPRPIPLIRELRKRPTTALTTGNTYENRANLSETFFSNVAQRYEGTRLGRQELYAELLEDVEGALWTHAQIDKLRVQEAPAASFKRVVVSIDPAVTAHEQSNESGIIVAGLGHDNHGYILADASSRYTPDGWGRKVVALYHAHHADRIVGEVNNGGDLIGYTIKTVDPRAAYKALRASRGKRTRAEPVAALYEQGKVHHVGGYPQLEDQLCTWDSTGNDESPDRLDALVWALTELMLESRDVVAVVPAPDNHWQRKHF